MKEILLKKESPEYVIQPNVISQAIYDLSPYARKLIAMAMAEMSISEGEFTVRFKAGDFIRSLELPVGGTTKNSVKAAVKECLKSHIEIEHPNGDWEAYTWFTGSRLTGTKLEKANGWEYITMTFNPKLGETIKAFKKAYAKISLADLGKLQSRYAIRFYELALSYSGFAGRGGNPSGSWYFENTLEEIRTLFQVKERRYQRTGNFRVNIIDKPIEEINAAGLGIRIEPVYAREGKFLIGARFNCRWVKRDEPVPANPATETGQEEEALRAAFPEEFEKYKAEALTERRKQAELFDTSQESLNVIAEGAALARLREEHPDLFKKRYR